MNSYLTKSLLPRGIFSLNLHLSPDRKLVGWLAGWLNLKRKYYLLTIVGLLYIFTFLEALQLEPCGLEGLWLHLSPGSMRDNVGTSVPFHLPWRVTLHLSIIRGMKLHNW